MVSMSSLHSLTAELHSGALTLAFICIMAVALSQLVVAHKKLFGPTLTGLAIKVRGYAEATGYVAAVAGLIGLLLSAWTGMYAWPQEDLLLSEEVRNKITLTVFATVLWAIVVAVRMRFGRGLWTCPAMATVYTLIAVAAMSVTGATGSIGAHLTKGESLLDPLWNLLNVTITESFVLRPSIAGGIALFSMIGLIIALIYAKRAGLFDVKLAPETCQKYFKWDEPVIPASGEKQKGA